MIVAAAISFILFFNFKMIPRGYHLAQPATKYDPHGNWVQYIMFDRLSMYIFHNTGVYCDAPIYDKNMSLVEGKGGTLSIIMAGYDSQKDYPEYREFWLNEFNLAAEKCDPNIRADYDNLTALQSAILIKNSQMVDTLLRHGADPSIKTYFKNGSDLHHDALEFARRLKKKATSPDEIAELEKIEALLLAKQGAGNNQRDSVPNAGNTVAAP